MLAFQLLLFDLFQASLVVRIRSFPFFSGTLVWISKSEIRNAIRKVVHSRHGQASLTAKDSLGATALMIAVQHKQLGGKMHS